MIDSYHYGHFARNVWNLVALLVCGTFGLIGNILLIIIFYQKDLRIRFNGLIMTLAIFDFLYICICFGNDVCLYYKFHNGNLFYALENFLFYCSIFTVTMICIERYLVVCRNK